MKTRLLTLAAAAAALTLGTLAAEAKTKACFIYVGPIGDFGWSYQHHQGALEAQKNAGRRGTGRARLSRKRAGRRRRRASARAFRPLRLQHHLHHILRLHGCDQRGGEEIPRREVRACHRLQARVAERLDLQLEIPRRPLRAGRDCRQDVQGRRRRLHRFLPDPGSRDGHQLLRARSAVGQPGLQAQGGVGQHLVRPGQGSRRCQGADRPGRRHRHPAHRLDRAHAGRGRARHQGVRAGVRHDQLRQGNPAHLDRRQLGSLLHQAHQGGDRRQLGAESTSGAA